MGVYSSYTLTSSVSNNRIRRRAISFMCASMGHGREFHKTYAVTLHLNLSRLRKAIDTPTRLA